MRTRSIALASLVLAGGVGAAWLATIEQRRNRRPWTFLVTDITPGLVMIVAGVLILQRRPQNRCWWLLVAAGFTWYVGDFEHSTDRNVALVAFAFGAWYEAFLGWAVLAFPTGRLQLRRTRAVTASLFVLVGMRSLSRVFLHVPPDVAGYGTKNRFLPITDERWWRDVERVFSWTFPIAVLLVLAAVAARWARSSAPARRMLTPALGAAIVLAAAVAYNNFVGWHAPLPSDTGVRAYYVVWWAHAALALALAIGLLRLRTTRSAVVDLVAELGQDAPPPSRLGEALGRALGDTSLKLVPWSPAAAGYVDSDGRAVELPADQPDRAVTRIERQGQPIAALLHDSALLEDPGLVNAVVAAVRLTIDNERMQAEIETQLAEVAASRARIVAAGDAERRRIERDLHDGAQQRLVTIALTLRLAHAQLADDSDPRVEATVSQAVKDLGEAIAELRDLARGIHPAILTESGLAVALESLIERSPVPVTLDVGSLEQPPGDIAAAAYFAVSEALTNVAKHADARTVTVRACTCADTLEIDITDDGRGGADPRRGTGLRGIADRVSTVGGTLRIHTPASGGTHVEVALPCASS